MSDPREPLSIDDLPPGAIRQVHRGSRLICVANVDGTIYAVSDNCTHAAIPLSGGALSGRQIICPWHGAMFDLKTGRATCGPATDPVAAFPVTVGNDGIIEIDADNPLPDPEHG